jgi:hypothetical protein
VFGKAGTWPGDGVDSAIGTGTYKLGSGGSLINGTQGFRLDGVNAYDLSGGSVAAGDVNGDGKTDLIIGALYGSYSASNAGSTYVAFGHTRGYSWPVTSSLSTLQ